MSKKNVAFLKEENLLTLLSQNNFIVPEIQREYVWGENEKVIIGFLKGLKNKIGNSCNVCNLPSSENKINIGFLYSYKPEYVKIEQERFLDENLIDGQQRFTTLFLLLFFCALKEKRKGEFLSLIRFEEKLKMCFDFKVRDLTKRFLLEMVEKVENTEQLSDIGKQTWFLKDYRNDVSIKSIQKALFHIQSVFSDNIKYYNYLINYIVFWHFKTEATSQGEELYITMNARGEDLADNEVTKAALMVDGAELYEWGKKWEEWQQFFWVNRDKENRNPSADKGFNGFLSCIAGFESYLNYDKWDTAEKDIQKLLSLEKVEQYFNSFKYLNDNKETFKGKYNYSDWVDDCLSEIWDIFNDNSTDWFSDYKDENKGTAISRMVFIWSVFYYLNTRQSHQGLIEAFRVLRLFYIRFNNFNRAITGLKENINQINQYGPFKAPCGPEENLKHNLLCSVPKNEEINFEETIWEIEDHPLNLDGSDVGDKNISHLVDLSSPITLENLINIKACFLSLFPNGTKKGNEKLKTILLFYGDYWKDTSNQNYYRYDFSDWKRNIRKPTFKVFMNDLIGKNPEQLLTEVKEQFLSANINEINNSNAVLPAGFSITKKLAYYSFLLSVEELWGEGEKVIISDEADSPRLFDDEIQIIYNSKGTFHGYYGNSDLWKKAISKFNSPLDEIKQFCSDL